MFKNISVLFLLMALPSLVLSAVITEPTSQHALTTIERPYEAQEFFGTLDAFPHTYVFSVQEEMPLAVDIYVYEEEGKQNDVTILLVKEEARGVTEVARTEGKGALWEPVYDATLAESFSRGGTLDAQLQPGSYRLEVSSPNNDAIYRLILGSGVSDGYFRSVQTLFAVKALVGSPTYTALLSPLLYVPLILLLLLFVWWRSNRKGRV